MRGEETGKICDTVNRGEKCTGVEREGGGILRGEGQRLGETMS